MTPSLAKGWSETRQGHDGQSRSWWPFSRGLCRREVPRRCGHFGVGRVSTGRGEQEPTPLRPCSNQSPGHTGYQVYTPSPWGYTPKGPLFLLAFLRAGGKGMP